MSKGRKGIILAGGTGTRLFPLTIAVSKQLMPIYDKPMIYYPLSILMLAGIGEVLIITTREDQHAFQKLLGDGSAWGIEIEYVVQDNPDGLPQAFLLAKEFLAGGPCALILGDNLFYGHGLQEVLARASSREGATVFGYYVKDPSRYGVFSFDDVGQVAGIEEKPANPQSHYVATGLYFFDSDAPDIASSLKPSDRGELEIVDVIRHYLGLGTLHVELFGRGIAWLDTGTHEDLSHASNFIQTIEERQGLKVCCPEEIAFHKGWIDARALHQLADAMGNTGYARYLRHVADDDWSVSRRTKMDPSAG
ncbi:MAG: glucose-1-phosphate thymidylyltransferase RfbA [Kofleriaceae bacterium]|nr:glucose-1-phosphate thymidylyltransferase RfbA [Kofleriaceae bacterium]